MHGYEHLLTGAAPNLECVACLHVDDISSTMSIDLIVDHAITFFRNVGEIPKTVSYEVLSERTDRRSSLSSFCSKMLAKGHMIGETVRSLTITSRGFEGGSLSETWMPRAAFSVRTHGMITEGFIQSPNALDSENGHLLLLTHQIFDDLFAAAYIFQFPWVFSALAYSTGISFSPNLKAVGAITDSDAERLTNWGNHCYRGHRASEGYMRDVYSSILLSNQHLNASLNGTSLAKWIKTDPTRGNLTSCRGKWLWMIDKGHLLQVQRELDDAQILLAGFPPSSQGVDFRT